MKYYLMSLICQKFSLSIQFAPNDNNNVQSFRQYFSNKFHIPPSQNYNKVFLQVLFQLNLQILQRLSKTPLKMIPTVLEIQLMENQN